MRPYHHWITAAIVACGAAILTAAQAAPSAPPARGLEPAAAQEALTSAEDVTLLKALDLLGLTRTQSSDLLPALQGTQANLTETESKEAAKLAAWQDSLEQARRDLLAGKGNGARASEQFALAQWSAAQKRASLRADLVSSLRATLEKILTPTQAAQMAESGQAVLLAQRTASWGGGGGWPGRLAGGRGGGPGGQLDRVREMSPAEFQQSSQQRADRMGGQSSPQFQQYTAFMSQVRDMPQSQYLLHRDQLTVQSLGQGRGGFGAALAGNNEEAARAYVDRYLLSPRAPVVVRDRLQVQ